MKLAIVQLSDMHCDELSDSYTMKIDQAIAAINSLGQIDNAVLVFSGDLTKSSSYKEFNAARNLIGRFLESLSTRLSCGFIPTMIVPGNHDILLTEESRKAEDIESWDKSEHLNDELQLMKNFFKYSKSKKCFKNNCLYDVKCIDVGDLKIQFVLLNSAPFSTLKPDDKQFHYLPPYVEEKMIRDTDVDFKITVMHHHFEWCEWNTKEMLLRSITSDDITLFGHDHKAESLTTKSSKGSTYNVVMGGCFDLNINNPAAFNVITYDSETNIIEQHEFEWNTQNRVFTHKKQSDLKKRNSQLIPNDEYLRIISLDNQDIGESVDEYFVFPKLFKEGEYFEVNKSIGEINADTVFDILNQEKIVGVKGNSFSGKTALLKHLYKESIKRGYLPLFIEKRDYKSNKIEKVIRDMVEIQYGEDSCEYEKYNQYDHTKEIVFVDNIDSIENEKSRSNFVSYIIESGRLLVYSTKEINQDLEKVVKERLQGKTGTMLEIPPFYKEKRDELVDKIGNIFKKSSEEKNVVIAALDYMVQCQADFFSLTPSNLIQYIKYFFNMGLGENKGIKTISIVFEHNIRNSLLSNIHEGEIVVYLTLLEFIANKMYFDLRTDRISPGVFERTVEEYNTKRKGKIVPKTFLDNCLKSNILMEYSGEFNIGFANKNIYAYFVACHMNREIEKNPSNLEKFNYVIRNICFGINDLIIVFLSYVKSNTNVLLNLSREAVALLDKYDEWDFDKNNIPLMEYSSEMPVGIPESKDKKHAKETTEIVEKNRQEVVKFRGIFDYSDEDANKEKYKILRAFKYTQIVGRAMVDQYGALEVDELEQIINALYILPQKLIYAMIEPYQKNIDNIINRILIFAEKELPGESITEGEVKKMISHAGINLALDVMNDIAYNSSSYNTANAFREYRCTTSNHKIMQLMIEENTGNTAVFIDKAIDLRKEMSKNPFAQMLIAQIARKHITYAGNVDHRQVSRLISGNVISSKSRTKVLLENGKKKKS